MPSRYALHVARWSDCTACELHSERRHVVLARGQLPCDVLFVGEAPGKAEDSLGSPFVGPAGQLLDRIVARSCGAAVLCPECRTVLCGGAAGIHCTGGHEFPSANCGVPVQAAFTNLIGCIPLDAGDGAKTSEPPEEAIEACKPRLEEFIDIAQPRLIVRVGKHAQDWIDPGYRHSIVIPQGVRLESIQHPSYLLRLSVIQRDLGVQRAIVTVCNALKQLGSPTKNQSV